jgi:cysteine desulfurase
MLYGKATPRVAALNVVTYFGATPYGQKRLPRFYVTSKDLRRFDPQPESCTNLSMKPIYLDYNATTPVDPAVLEEMLPYLREHFGNPSSAHGYGETAHGAVDRAREQVAALLGAEPEEIVFTGGGSEASNHAIKGVVFAKLGRLVGGAPPDLHIVTSAVEHLATLQPCDFLKRLGCRVTILPVDKYGIVDPDSVRKAIEPDTALITIMHANNEVGTIQPIREIAAVARERGVVMHTDAAQTVGKLPVDVNELDVDLLTVAGHKVYAPKGVGALYIRSGTKVEPLIHGAGHESGRRAGTENVPYVVALGKACEIARRMLPRTIVHLAELRDCFWERLRRSWGDEIILNGHPEKRLPNTLHVNFLDWIGAELLEAAPEIAASTGAACHDGSVGLSPVLHAMGVSAQVGRGAVRFSVGRFTTQEEIDRAAEAINRMSPARQSAKLSVS